MNQNVSQTDEQLRRLVEEACQHPHGSLLRQRYLTQIIRVINKSRKLWYESSQDYPDALQQTWMYFCQNICEAGTGERYDPDRASLTTWLNAYLKRRIQDKTIAREKQQATQRSSVRVLGDSGNTLDLVESLPTPAAAPPILESVLAWVESDPTGELRQISISKRPELTCQVLIRRRLPPETSWDELSQEFGVSISTLSSFYRRQCLPRLRKFGESEGYL